MKTLVSGNLFKLFGLNITFASLPLGNKDEDKYNNRLILLIIPNSKLPVHANVMVSLKSVNKLPNTRVFIAAEKWMVRSTGVGGLISLQNGNLRR